MKQIILITQEDIVTSRIGENIQIVPPNGLISLNFTKESLEELIKDYFALKAEAASENASRE